MLTMDHPQRRPRSLMVAAVMVAALLMPAPAALATDAVPADMKPVDADLAQATPSQLRTVIDELSTRNHELVTDNSTLQRKIDDLSSQRDKLAGSIQHFDDLYAPLEADRQLLVELRKGLPDTRDEIQSQLDRLKSLAASSDPARLGQVVDRVEQAAPKFLDWRFADYGSAQEASAAYVSSGANAFDNAMKDFQDAVLLSVANRLDGLLSVLDAID